MHLSGLVRRRVPVALMDVQKTIDEALARTEARLDTVSAPWFLYQAVIVAALFVAAKLWGRRIKARVEEWARGIKGRPGLRRLVAALLRRTSWILFSLVAACRPLIGLAVKHRLSERNSALDIGELMNPSVVLRRPEHNKT